MPRGIIDFTVVMQLDLLFHSYVIHRACIIKKKKKKTILLIKLIYGYKFKYQHYILM